MPDPVGRTDKRTHTFRQQWPCYAEHRTQKTPTFSSFVVYTPDLFDYQCDYGHIFSEVSLCFHSVHADNLRMKLTLSANSQRVCDSWRSFY